MKFEQAEKNSNNIGEGFKAGDGFLLEKVTSAFEKSHEQIKQISERIHELNERMGKIAERGKTFDESRKTVEEASKKAEEAIRQEADIACARSRRFLLLDSQANLLSSATTFDGRFRFGQ